MKQAALQHLKKGWSPIPFCGQLGNDITICNKPDCSGKHPLIQWKKFQRRLPTADEIEKWWKRWPEAHVGIVTGKVSGGVVVLDIDSQELASRILNEGKITGLVEKTPRGGLHIFLKESISHSPSRPLVPGVADLKANGGCVKTAPSPGYEVIQND